MHISALSMSCFRSTACILDDQFKLNSVCGFPGGDGGLDILGGPGLLLGSPEKKRRRSSTQAPSFSPLSEYAPPPNPSADHLIASNPFDDDYNSPSLKALPPANPYFVHSHYPGFSSYGPPRMSPRMPSPFGAPYQMRNQPHPFPQNPMGYNRTPGFNYSHPENPNYGQPFSSNIHFRPNPGEHLSLQNLRQSASPGGLVFSPEGNPSPNLSQPQNNFTQCITPTPKQDPSEAMNKSTTQNCEENKTQDNAPELKTKSGAEKLNGVLHANNEAMKKSPRPTGNNGVSSNNKVVNRRSTSSSSEPVYPCGICLSEVNDDQEAILCEASCQKWFHRVCTGMTETAYNLLTAETSAVWGCDACMEDKGAQLLKTREASGTITSATDTESH